MPQQVRTRRHTIINFQADSRVQEELKRGMIIRELMLKLQGTIDVGADGGQAAAGDGGHQTFIGPADAWASIERIEIVANGSDVLRVFSGEELFWFNYFWYGSYPPIDPQLWGADADDNIAFEYTLVIPFWMPSAIRPFDTALDTRLLSDLRIEIQWRDYDSFVNGGVGAGWVVEPTIEVYALESFGVQGPFSQSRIHRIRQTSVAVNTQHEVDLPVTSIYRAILINTKKSAENDNPEAIDAPDYLDNIKLRSGTTVFQDLEARLLQDWVGLRMGKRTYLADPLYDAVAGLEPIPERCTVSSLSDLHAWYYLDLVTDGRLSEGIDTLGFSELILELDVNTEIDYLTVLPVQIIPIRGPAGQRATQGAKRGAMVGNQARRVTA